MGFTFFSLSPLLQNKNKKETRTRVDLRRDSQKDLEENLVESQTPLTKEASQGLSKKEKARQISRKVESRDSSTDRNVNVTGISKKQPQGERTNARLSAEDAR